VKAAVNILAVFSLALAGVASAQPAPQPAPQAGPAAEEPPPVEVAPPPPVVTPLPPVDIQPLPDAPRPRAQPKSEAPAKVEEPIKRVRAGSAIVQALDKVTAETLRFEVPVGQSVRYKNLVFTVRACESAAPDEEAPESAAYMVVDSQPKPQPGRPAPPTRQVFRGWMFASSPGLNPLQHPVYDAWLIACKAA
jgi:hypothetical protein